jgi:hypothetical protein
MWQEKITLDENICGIREANKKIRLKLEFTILMNFRERVDLYPPFP